MSDEALRIVVGAILLVVLIVLVIWLVRELRTEEARAAIEAGRGWCRTCRPAFGGGA